MTAARREWRRVIGIVGGLGPHAHVEFERRLLAAVAADRDQDYPPWCVVSSTETPDRTACLTADGTSPVPSLGRSLLRLERAGADFAIVVCHTAHAFLDRLDGTSSLPILDIVREVVVESRRWSPRRRVGLLATTGALESRIYQRALASHAPELEVFTLLDLEGGAELQRQLVMEPVYGVDCGAGPVGGLKAGRCDCPKTRRAYSECFAEAARALEERGADCVIWGCTEISVAMAGRRRDREIPGLDPMDVAVRECLRVASGERSLVTLRRGDRPPSQIDHDKSRTAAAIRHWG